MQQAYLNKKSCHTLRQLTQIHRSDGFDLSMSDHNSIISSSNATQEHICNNNNNNINNNNTTTANISQSTTLLNYPRSVLVTAPAEHPRTMSVLDSESVTLQSMSSGAVHVCTPSPNGSKIKCRQHEESSNRHEHPELIVTTITTTNKTTNANNFPASALTLTANKINQNGSPTQADLVHLTSVTQTNLPHVISETEHTALPANEDNGVKCVNSHINNNNNSNNNNDNQHENAAAKDERTNLYD